MYLLVLLLIGLLNQFIWRFIYVFNYVLYLFIYLTIRLFIISVSLCSLNALIILSIPYLSRNSAKIFNPPLCLKTNSTTCNKLHIIVTS